MRKRRRNIEKMFSTRRIENQYHDPMKYIFYHPFVCSRHLGNRWDAFIRKPWTQILKSYKMGKKKKKKEDEIIYGVYLLLYFVKRIEKTVKNLFFFQFETLVLLYYRITKKKMINIESMLWKLTTIAK